MAKRRTVSKRSFFHLWHLMSRVFLIVVFFLLLGIVLSFVLAAEGGGQFAAAVDTLWQGAKLLAIPLASLMVLFAGYQYMTAAYEPGQVKEAKETIAYALGGLVLLFAGFQLLNWLMGAESPFAPILNLVF